MQQITHYLGKLGRNVFPADPIFYSQEKSREDTGISPMKKKKNKKNVDS